MVVIDFAMDAAEPFTGMGYQSAKTELDEVGLETEHEVVDGDGPSNPVKQSR